MDHHHHHILPVSVRATVAFIIFTKWLLLCSPPSFVIVLIILCLECFRLLTPQTRNWRGFDNTTFRPLHQECNEGVFQLLTLFSFGLRQCYKDKRLFAKRTGLSLRIKRLLWYCAFSLLIHSLATWMTHCIPVGCRMASGTMGDQNSFAVLWICTSAASFLL